MESMARRHGVEREKKRRNDQLKMKREIILFYSNLLETVYNESFMAVRFFFFHSFARFFARSSILQLLFVFDFCSKCSAQSKYAACVAVKCMLARREKQWQNHMFPIKVSFNLSNYHVIRHSTHGMPPLLPLSLHPIHRWAAISKGISFL